MNIQFDIHPSVPQLVAFGGEFDAHLQGVNQVSTDPQTYAMVADIANKVTTIYAQTFNIDQDELRAHLIDVGQRFTKTESFQKGHWAFYDGAPDQQAYHNHPQIKMTRQGYQLHALMELAAAAHTGQHVVPEEIANNYNIDLPAGSAKTILSKTSQAQAAQLVNNIADDKILYWVGERAYGDFAAFATDEASGTDKPAVMLFVQNVAGGMALSGADRSQDISLFLHEGTHATDMMDPNRELQTTWEEQSFLFEYKAYLIQTQFDFGDGDSASIAKYLHCRMSESCAIDHDGVLNYPYNNPGSSIVVPPVYEHMSDEHKAQFIIRRDKVYSILENGGLLTVEEVATIMDQSTTDAQIDTIVAEVQKRSNKD